MQKYSRDFHESDALLQCHECYTNVKANTQMLRFILPKRLFPVCISYYGFNLIKIRNFRLVYFHYFLRSHIQKHFTLLGLYSFFLNLIFCSNACESSVQYWKVAESRIIFAFLVKSEIWYFFPCIHYIAIFHRKFILKLST